VLGRLLGVFHEDVEVSILVEHAGVEQLVLELAAAARAARVDELRVRVSLLRILVEIFHVGVGRRAVEVEVVLLDVLAVIAFAVGQAEEALFDNGILAIPEREREAELLMIVGDAGQAVFAPAVGAGAGLIVAEIIPGVAALAVVLADRAPLSFAEVGAPLLPWRFVLTCLLETVLFAAHGLL